MFIMIQKCKMLNYVKIITNVRRNGKINCMCEQVHYEPAS